MNKKDFYFDLPPSLIAQYPLASRSASRLLCYQRATQAIEHDQFCHLADRLKPGDLLVMNDSRVIPARLYGKKITGGQIELLVERILDEHVFLAHIKASHAPKPGSVILLQDNESIEVIEKKDDLYRCRTIKPVLSLLNAQGHIPLPPYITRDDEAADVTRYQTIYAQQDGSVAAPTAGLHFDEQVITSLSEKNIDTAYVTLHVGSGTFRPVKSEVITDHKMHTESYCVTQALCDAIAATKARGGRVIAVGTTALRCLESAAQLGALQPIDMGETNIFIYPGFQFRVCDGLITNFHLPESTLLMLVSAFIGHPQAMALYQEAIAHGYRFFSYGDTSLLL